MIRTLIVDDERIARQGLRTLLAKEKDIEIVGECSGGGDAVRAIGELHPDLVFLDVQMPDLNGFEVLARLDIDEPPVVVFVTAHDQHAVRAFDVNALDYLLKPFDRSRLLDSVRRARRQLAQRGTTSAGLPFQRLLSSAARDPTDASAPYLSDRLMVRDSGRIRFVRPESIVWAEVQHNYVRLHAGEKSYLIRATLSEIEAELGAKQFLRISRSQIVNLERVTEIRILPNGRYRLVAEDGTELISSRRYAGRVRESLSL